MNNNNTNTTKTNCGTCQTSTTGTTTTTCQTPTTGRPNRPMTTGTTYPKKTGSVTGTKSTNWPGTGTTSGDTDTVAKIAITGISSTSPKSDSTNASNWPTRDDLNLSIALVIAQKINKALVGKLKSGSLNFVECDPKEITGKYGTESLAEGMLTINFRNDKVAFAEGTMALTGDVYFKMSYLGYGLIEMTTNGTICAELKNIKRNGSMFSGQYAFVLEGPCTLKLAGSLTCTIRSGVVHSIGVNVTSETIDSGLHAFGSFGGRPIDYPVDMKDVSVRITHADILHRTQAPKLYYTGSCFTSPKGEEATWA